ncbi:MAG: class I SAM-dependent methyltransferase [Rhodospirillales bacterium]|nr:class I SAM-dependent methyltransferase [Rhodospirillales bacterium]
MRDPVRDQYEALPYPPRDPRDEAKRLITGSPSQLAELVHFVFAGRFDPAQPFRALIAGGGTGDAAIMLGQQLADAGATQARIVYLDRSAAARRIAEARAAARRLVNIEFATGSIIDLPSLGLGVFDYIDCCGVLHHLDAPEAGLECLAEALNERGGIGLMLYGTLGRTGVYPAQAMLRTLGAAADDIAAQTALARKLVAALPATNWLKRNPFVADHITAGDPGLYDLLLHARDRAYTAPEIAMLATRAELRIVAFTPPARYEPASYLSDPILLRRLDGADPVTRAAFAEDLAGNMKTHVAYLVRATNPTAPPQPGNPDAIPILCDTSAEALAKSLKPGGTLGASIEGLTLRFPLPPLAPAIAGLIDGRRSLADIRAVLVERLGTLAEDDFMRQFRLLHAALNGIGKLFLRRPPAG